MTTWRERVLFGCLGLLVASFLVLVGWIIWYQVNDPGHGTITKKHYDAPYITQQCSSAGNVVVCTPISHPECYDIEYTDGRHDGDACVSPAEYQTYTVGAQYPHREPA